jgi:DNA-directed RNA polymerase subunit M/transcription elongation factor TFIIS
MKSQKQYIQESIDRMVRECINEMLLDEKKKKGSKKNKKGPKKVEYKNKDLWKNKSKEDPRDNRKKENKIADGESRRARVIQWLKDDTVNCAEIMRKLWHPSKRKEDAARSYFYKCRDGELNDTGVPYSFSDADINRLYSIKNNLL